MNDMIQNTIAALTRHAMTGYFIENPEDLFALLSSLIKEGQIVGCGDSVTLEETGVYDFLRSGTYRFLDKYDADLTAEKKRQIYLANFDADTFVTGTNAVTMDGKLFNIDGNGSRVAPMLYGPRQVIVLVGKNKIVPDVETAIVRARQQAAPLDAKRLGKGTPCISLGRCIDCRHPQRICNDFVLITGQFSKNRIKVIILDWEAGY